MINYYNFQTMITLTYSKPIIMRNEYIILSTQSETIDKLFI